MHISNSQKRKIAEIFLCTVVLLCPAATVQAQDKKASQDVYQTVEEVAKVGLLCVLVVTLTNKIMGQSKE
jgi:hypothetical protein